MDIDSAGNLYYADLGLERHPEKGFFWPAPGKGTVRRVGFDQDGNPLPPETLFSGLTYPDAVSILRLPDATG